MYVTGKHLPAEGLGTATNWTVVQAYYAVYLVAKATAIAQGKTGPLDSHPLIQRFFIDFWVEGDRRDLAPWSTVFGFEGPRNMPTNVDLGNALHAWSSARREECWVRLAKAWETTRADSLNDALKAVRTKKARDRQKAWNDTNAARVERQKKPLRRPPAAAATLNSEEKAIIDRSVRPAGLLDYLYRLRIRSNYEDSAMWSEGPASAEESLGVHWNLATITSATLLVHEVLLRRIVGASTFDGLTNEWLQKNGVLLDPREGLRLRAEVLRYG
ncbi:MAG: hypothetical protein CVU47_07440 [Chloroflexi bacterium HGW-Chloroflexi-9]|nr:MAG: hypothetical protein CVU47_07440 [Chloroflexi bacterium HGW-Chloroflexi-9]